MHQRLRSILRSIKRTPVGWRYGSNLSSTIGYWRDHESRLRPVEKQIARDLDTYGIAISSIDKVLADSAEFEKLDIATGLLLRKKKADIDGLQFSANDESSVGSKTFNLEMLGSEVDFDPQSIFARFALNSSFLNIANTYFRMLARLRYYNVWYTAASKSTARESQLWHFDREDNYILKAFLYLDDVDEGAGPFTYAPATHKKGQFRSINPQHFLEGGVRRTTDEQMDAVYPKKDWKMCTGKKGTIVFADTRGFHKGGEARSKDRLMYTCMFTSPASESKDLLKIPADLRAASLTLDQRRALGIL